MSVAGSSSLVYPYLGGSSGGKASISDGSLGAGPAGPFLQFRSSPSSLSPDSVLDGSTLMRQEQPGQQKQIALTSVDMANSSKRQNVQNQTKRQNNPQAHVMQPSNQLFSSLDNKRSPCLINYQHQQKSVNHQHQEQQQPFERSYPPMHQYALQHMNDLLPQQGNCANWFKKCIADKRYLIHENSRKNWEQFVEKYYAPQAKIRWCFSSYGNAGNHRCGVFPQIACTKLPCDLCHATSGNGFALGFWTISRVMVVDRSSDWTTNISADKTKYFPRVLVGNLPSGNAL